MNQFKNTGTPKLGFWSLATFILLAFAACEKNNSALDFKFGDGEATSEESFRSDAQDQGTYQVGLVSANANGATDDAIEKESTPAVDLSQQMDKSKIIRNGWITVEVEKYDQARESLGQLVESFGAFISRENEQRDEYRIHNNLEIKVHNSRFDELMDAVSKAKGVAHVDERRTTSVDVGEEYYDLQSRLKTKREVEQRYLSILKKATTIKDILSVEDKIRVIREEIESAQGRLNYLSDRVSRSTIHIEMYQNLDYTVPSTERRGFGSKLVRALESGWNGILNAIVFLGYLWPLWVILIAVIALWRRMRKRRASK